MQWDVFLICIRSEHMWRRRWLFLSGKEKASERELHKRFELCGMKSFIVWRGIEGIPDVSKDKSGDNVLLWDSLDGLAWKGLGGNKAREEEESRSTSTKRVHQLLTLIKISWKYIVQRTVVGIKKQWNW